MNELLTTSDAAHLAKRTPQTIRQAAQRGLLTPEVVTRGGQRLFTPEAVNRYLAEAAERRRRRQPKV